LGVGHPSASQVEHKSKVSKANGAGHQSGLPAARRVGDQKLMNEEHLKKKDEINGKKMGFLFDEMRH
jgi:hypothetical protein